VSAQPEDLESPELEMGGLNPPNILAIKNIIYFYRENLGKNHVSFYML
jgi:hypothetical protein